MRHNARKIINQDIGTTNLLVVNEVVQIICTSLGQRTGIIPANPDGKALMAIIIGGGKFLLFGVQNIATCEIDRGNMVTGCQIDWIMKGE
jgi:hypothetical protein